LARNHVRESTNNGLANSGAKLNIEIETTGVENSERRKSVANVEAHINGDGVIRNHLDDVVTGNVTNVRGGGVRVAGEVEVARSAVLENGINLTKNEVGSTGKIVANTLSGLVNVSPQVSRGAVIAAAPAVASELKVELESGSVAGINEELEIQLKADVKTETTVGLPFLTVTVHGLECKSTRQI
jgi:hypothetical protein